MDYIGGLFVCMFGFYRRRELRDQRITAFSKKKKIKTRALMSRVVGVHEDGVERSEPSSTALFCDQSCYKPLKTWGLFHRICQNSCCVSITMC